MQQLKVSSRTVIVTHGSVKRGSKSVLTFTARDGVRLVRGMDS